MTRSNTLTVIALAAIIPATNYCSQWAYAQLAQGKASITSAAVAAEGETVEPQWIASAPGRVEPISGEVNIGATMPGRIIAVPVAENQHVEAGDILVLMDDEGAVGRFQAAKIEAARSKKERDDAGGGDSEYRTAEDDVASAELAFWNARDALDRAAGKVRAGEASEGVLTDARKSYEAAKSLLDAKRNALIDLQGRKKRPNPSRVEAQLAAARSEQSLAAAALEKTRIRAPIAGTILKIDAKAGEVVTPSPEQVLVLMGDTAKLRVRAELEERDIGKVKLGQQSIIRADAFQGQDFAGKVTFLAPTLAAPELGARGPNRRNDIDVLKIYVELDPATPLLPGMRVDVFFKEGTDVATTAPAAGATQPAAGTP